MVMMHPHLEEIQVTLDPDLFRHLCRLCFLLKSSRQIHEGVYLRVLLHRYLHFL